MPETPQTSRAWSRIHKNGMIASVSEFPGGENRYSAGAGMSGAAYWLGDVHGSLKQAQAYADAEANCQNCDCAPWQD